MRAKVKRMNWFVRLITAYSTFAITLAPFGIYLDDESPGSFPTTINHERIHWKQQLEMLLIFFYLWYLAEWIIRRLFINGRRAYHCISFERECYANHANFLYPEAREPYSWTKYLRHVKDKKAE